jgi:hypothetical protein
MSLQASFHMLTALTGLRPLSADAEEPEQVSLHHTCTATGYFALSCGCVGSQVWHWERTAHLLGLLHTAAQAHAQTRCCTFHLPAAAPVVVVQVTLVHRNPDSAHQA